MPPAHHPPSPAPPAPVPRGATAGRAALVLLGLGALVAAAVVEGVRSNRWGVPDDLKAAAARLDRVPAAFGDWTGTEVPIEQKVLDRAEAVGAVSRIYKNKQSGAVVSVLLLCGPAGPIGSHTPDICYAGLGYQMVGGEARRTVAPPAGPASYWSARFAKDAADPGQEVCWAWGADGTWSASDSPRREFVLHTVLYKLYASRGLAHTAAARPGATEPDPIHDFLAEFLPVLRTALDPGPG
ncbi:exosortase-associated EpsI family protein [bacterium]|nr:exosortase-associated EpsI family protein [bacterium]